jgi:hypothetical protein
MKRRIKPRVRARNAATRWAVVATWQVGKAKFGFVVDFLPAGADAPAVLADYPPFVGALAVRVPVEAKPGSRVELESEEAAWNRANKEATLAGKRGVKLPPKGTPARRNLALAQDRDDERVELAKDH